jgi:2'-5' RNA ligase superfamily
VEPITGVAVPIALPGALARLRRHWDFAASLGARSHVTVLYPFVPVASLTPDVRRDLEAIARTVEPFDVRFETVRWFDTVVWLDPIPAEPFRRLTAALVARWPDHPPYGGVHDEVIPHLTITESDDAPLEAIAAAAQAALPIVARATALELWRQDETEHWHPHWRVALG